MPAITHPQRQSAEVERATATSIGALDTPNIQLVMTYSGLALSSEISPELASWLNARCEETGSSALEILIACAELCADME